MMKKTYERNILLTMFFSLAAIIGVISCSNHDILSEKIGDYPVASDQEYLVLEKVPIEPAWPATRVGFCLLTHETHQFAAYYDSNRQMSVAHRLLTSKEWTIKRLPSHIGSDSHNYVTMALDREGHLHVSGNMHGVPLIYFKSSDPYDVNSLEKVSSMVGTNEQKVTYPNFFKNLNDELVFTYRDGGSGDGNNYYNIYNTSTRAWTRLFDLPFTDGEGLMNAYNVGPVKGPDGWFHMSWVWRDTPAAETNHDLSYAKSPDLVNWYTAAGDPLTLPIKLSTPGVIVDPVPIKCGMINGNGRIGFDSQNRVILSYHKFEDCDNSNAATQFYNARFENGAWEIYQTTNWNYRWYFEGGGSLSTEVSMGEVFLQNGQLRQNYTYKGRGSGIFVLSEETLKPIGTDVQIPWPYDVRTVRSKYPNMGTRVTPDETTSADGVSYVMRHETLPSNRDQPWPEPWPDPVMLEVYKLKQGQ